MVGITIPVCIIPLLAGLLLQRSVTAFHVSTGNPFSAAKANFLSTSTNSPSTDSCDILDSFGIDQQHAQNLLDTAQSAARAAGSIILDNLGCSNQQQKRPNEQDESVTAVKYSIKDVVTQYDKEAQAAVLQVIQSKYPNHAFLGEEDVGAGSQASEEALVVRLEQTAARQAVAESPSMDEVTKSDTGFLWICDPIDGTANFASGLPLCGVTVALVYRGTPLIGVIYDPHRDEMFSAVRGQGATMNGKDIHVTTAISDVKDAIINAGCPADTNAFAASMRGMLALNGACRGLRIIACSAMTLPWIACGRLTAHFGYDLSSWDLVAGALIIEEAGGVVTELDGSPYTLRTRSMLCSNGRVHCDILSVLKDADAVSFERAS